MLLRRLWCLLFLGFCLTDVCRAQSSPPGNVVIDGQLKEWGDTLRYYDKAARLYYDVHNDHDFLYIALRRPKHAWKIVLAERMSFEISKDKDDKDGLKIFYPGHFTLNKDDMWNFLEVKRAGGQSFDTLTIYNDYGLQAAGGFWEQEQKTRKSSAGDMLLSAVPASVNGMPSTTEAPKETVTGIVGADCELAIPMKLLPATSGAVYIQIVIPGEKDIVAALNGVGYLAGFNMERGTPEAVDDLMVESKLSITYRLK
ncbi:hypothetical protein SAMN04488128_104256 [Chitinophaga eiseniae]|uniref:Carbohydrate family 9 binding domain-like n=1 Tax=Chitinophaga eiseniae TaxID=634771 RepID=A0A1T4TA90_9BACT|nr:hypothetical protein SAMN04488128_104256 [Chitinophaga eiseniae]